MQLAPHAPLARDSLMQWLLERGIATRRGIMLAHLEPACADLPPCHLPLSEQASARSLLLPLYPQMTDDQQHEVIAALAAAGRSHAVMAAPIRSVAR